MVGNVILKCKNFLDFYKIPYQTNKNNLIFYLFNGTIKMKLRYECCCYYLFKYFEFNNRYHFEWGMAINDFDSDCYDVLKDLIDKHYKYNIKGV